MNGKPSILITGATGVIGQALTERLLQLGYRIGVVVRDLEHSRALFAERAEYIHFNGKNFTDNVVTFRPDIVIHLASYSTSRDDSQSIVSLIDSNLLFISLLLEKLKDSPLKLLINSGSFSEYHHNDAHLNPTYFYSATKTASRFVIDYFSQLNGFAFINAILYSVYGKKGTHKKILDYIVDAIDAPQPVAMSDGHQILDFIHIDDVISFFVQAVEKYQKLEESRYHEYHIGSGRGHSIRELAGMTAEISRRPLNIAWGSVEARQRDTVQAVADTKSVADELGWHATIPLEKGIERYLTEYGVCNADG